jgi:(hydroxyamino)benzene mutase
MEIQKADVSLVRAGFLLFTLALLTGLAEPVLLNQKMGVAAHVTGVMNALLLVALGLSWGLFTISPMQARLTRGAFLYATFVNWGSSCLAAVWGTNRLTPVGGAGFGAQPWQEGVVQFFQVTLALAILGGAVLVLYALRGKGASR